MRYVSSFDLQSFDILVSCYMSSHTASPIRLSACIELLAHGIDGGAKMLCFREKIISLQ